MVPDLLIWVGFLVAVAGWCVWQAKRGQRAAMESPPPDPVPVAVRLVADRRERVSRADVSAVRARNGRVARFSPSPIQRAAMKPKKEA
jgi:hypothetical protein